jgi:hypothetical protein
MTDFQALFDKTYRSINDYFLENRKEKTMQISQEVADIYLKGLQKSQQDEVTVAPKTYTFYSLAGQREIKVV